MKSIKSILIFTFLLPYFAFSQQTTIYDTSYVGGRTENHMEIIKTEGVLKNGLKTGVWISRYPNGNIMDSCEYIIITKNEIHFYVDGENWENIDTIKLKKGLKNEYSVKTGHCISYYSNGQIMSEGDYTNYARVEIVFLVDPNNMDLIYNISEPREVKIGKWKEYDENGKLYSSLDFRNGEKPYPIE